MPASLLRVLIFVALALASPAMAGDLVVDVADDNGTPVRNAVVTLRPSDGSVPPPMKADLSSPKIIDQVNEQFVPLVTILAPGGAVVFKNSDRTRHHVYSFSTIKPFEFVLNPGKQSPPVVMENAGIAAIGCNIHDRMVAYVFVSDTEWTALTDANGRVTFPDVPDGPYKVAAWHPQLKSGDAGPQQDIAIAGSTQSAKFAVSLSAERPHGGHQREY